MSSRISSIPEDTGWKKAYMSAVLEKDPQVIPHLIQVARDSLSQRLQELLLSGPFPNEEIEAIHDASYLLEALRSSLSYRDESPGWNQSVADS